MAIKAYHDSRGESNRKVGDIIRSHITLACLLGKNKSVFLLRRDV